MDFFRDLLFWVSIFYVFYLISFATVSFSTIIIGTYKLYNMDRVLKYKNKLEHEDLPVSVIVPAHNEEITIVNSVESLLALDYNLYEIIIVDDGSKDETSAKLIERFDLKAINRPINRELECQPERAVYENVVDGVSVTLINKENGGKGDALNMGINACRYPYFICMDADSKLQKNSLTEIVEPVFEDESTVAVGGMILISQCVKMEDGMAVAYNLPPNLLVAMQAVEYNRSFLAARLMMDTFNGNLIVSGAFGLFKRTTVVAAGGYSAHNLGEDMELILKIHGYCRNNDIEYNIGYQPSAVCMTQAPTNLKDLGKQRRRWHIGLIQSMWTHRRVFLNTKFGAVSFFSYVYYLLYELLSPIIEVFGLVTIALALYFDILNLGYMVVFLIVYAIFGSIITLSAFSQHIYTQKFKISPIEMVKTLFLCILEFGFFRYFLVVLRLLAFLRYKKNKSAWGQITRVEEAATESE